MRICFPWATRCPVCIFGLVLDWPRCKGGTKHRGRLFYFKSRGNRSKLVHCLHIPLAMPAMFQSKRKPAEEMLSQGLLSCFHAIRVPLPSGSPVPESLLPIFSFKLDPPPPTRAHIHIDSFARPVAMSPRRNSCMNWTVEILAAIRADGPRCCTKQRRGVSV